MHGSDLQARMKPSSLHLRKASESRQSTGLFRTRTSFGSYMRLVRFVFSGRHRKVPIGMPFITHLRRKRLLQEQLCTSCRDWMIDGKVPLLSADHFTVCSHLQMDLKSTRCRSQRMISGKPSPNLKALSPIGSKNG